MNLPTQPEEVAEDPRMAAFDICVVDHDSATVEMLRETLTSCGYRCFGTSEPEEALKYVSKGNCRIVLCDLQMPRMDGLTFLEQALFRDPGVYVILTTGFYSIDSAIQAI